MQVPIFGYNKKALRSAERRVVIGYLLLFSNTSGIHGVALCMVVAWALQLLIQLPFAKKFGYDFKFNLN